jgi:hypothetical protein
MLKKMLVLALLLPGVGGCIWHEGHGRGHDERGRGHEEQRGGHERAGAEEHLNHPETLMADSAHAHGAGCGHVFQGCFWIDAD